MAISTFAELKTAVANWVGRADLTSRIPEFIALAEADMRRNLRDSVTREALVIDSDTETLPAALGELRSIRFNTGTREYPLTITTPENLAALRRSGSGVPFYAAVVGDTILFDVTPDTSYTMEIVYFDQITPLSDSNTSNNTLASSPDIYLFGALKEAELYLEHDERNPIWAQKYQKAVNDENTRRELAELGAAPRAPRLPIVLG